MVHRIGPSQSAAGPCLWHFYKIYSFKRPVIGRINGAAIGGGTGFVAVCDIAVAARSAVFSFSEVKIGIVPACIGPYVIKRALKSSGAAAVGRIEAVALAYYPR